MKSPEQDDLPKIGKPAQRALASIGITRLSQVTKVSKSELGQLHGVGPKALGILEKALEAQSLSFAREK
jgi:predicted flap endonuclease-1-like 5' DNA nuclease